MIATCLTYGRNNRLDKIIEAVDTPEEKVTSYYYDEFGQKERVVHADGATLQHRYDGKGRLANFWAEDNSFSYAYYYDNSDRVVRINNNLTNEVSYRDYNDIGELTAETLESGLKIGYNYDQAGRLATLTLPDGSRVGYDYKGKFLKGVTRLNVASQKQWNYEIKERDQSGHILSCKLPKKAGSINYSYDKLGRRISTQHPAFKEKATEFDPVGNLTQLDVKDQTGSFDTRYTYDWLSQLTSETGPTPHTYCHDSLYDRLTLDDKSYDVNSLHSVLSDTNHTFRYDKRGNRLQMNDDTFYRLRCTRSPDRGGDIQQNANYL